MGFRQFLPYSIRQTEIDTMEQRMVKMGISSLRLTDPTKAPPNADIWYGAKSTACQICGATNSVRTVRCKKCDAFIFKKNVNGRHADRVEYMKQYTAHGDEFVDAEREKQRLEKKMAKREGRR